MPNNQKPIKLLREVLISENPWLSIYFDEVIFPNGKKGNYNRIVEKGGDGIVIVPVNSAGEIGLVRLFRYPIDSYVWELPRGFGEGLSPLEEATRELKEEMGLMALEISYQGKIYPNTGILSASTHIVLAKIEPVRYSFDAKSEAIESTGFFSKDRVKEMVASGDIKDGISISALYLSGALN